jgi:pimeloyl-ACP methyl ester carboxylesterase
LFYYLNRDEELRKEMDEIISDHCGHLWLDPMRGKYKDRDDVSLSKNIKIPTMIFVGEKDRYFIPLAKKLHQKIVDSEIDIVPDVGHMLNMEAPERFNLRLEQFLERISGEN